MENESEVVANPTETVSKEETTKVEKEKVNNNQDDTVVVETPEAKRARLKRELERHERKYGFKEEEEKPAPKSQKSDEFDEGQLAYLATKQIESDELVEFTKAELKKHGGTLRELLNNEYFKASLKAKQDAKAILDATPTGSQRGGSQPNDTVDYHLSKYLQTGKLPADREMAQKVINARLKQEKSKRIFSDTPVVG